MKIRIYTESPETFYQSQYKGLFDKYDISDDIFYKLYKADPTSTDKYKGEFTVWILNQYVNLLKTNQKDKAERFVGEDIEKITSLLNLFITLKKKKIVQADVKVQQFATLNELYRFLSPYIVDKTETGEAPSKVYKPIKDVELLFNKDGWSVQTPKTYEASKKLAGSANWCNGNPDFVGGEKQCKKYYDDYTSKGPLLVIKHGREKWQFHMERGQWADASDETIDLYKWMRKKNTPTSLNQFLFNLHKKKMRVFNIDTSKIKKVNDVEVIEYDDGSIDFMGNVND